MFGLSFWEIGVILIIALVILGPKKLPELAKSLGKGIREFRNATDDFKSTMDEELSKPDPKKELPKPRPAAGPTAAADEVDAEVELASPEKVKEEVKPAATKTATSETT
ncbi:MAG: twin-arginine translocase TatA/TatE family subunit [Myxococcota bacterium]